MRVVVPLGPRHVVGLVAELASESEVSPLRPVDALIDPDGAVLDGETLALCRWMAEYYLGTFTEAVATALPRPLKVRLERYLERGPAAEQPLKGPLEDLRLRLVPLLPASFATLRREVRALGLRELRALARSNVILIRDRLRAEPRRFLPGERRYQVAPLWAAQAPEALGRSKALQAVLDYVRSHPLGSATHEELEATFPNASGKIRRLLKAGLLSCTTAWQPAVTGSQLEAKSPPAQLNQAQQAALDSIVQSLDHGFRSFLLWGVTGSGKTEVYLRAISACLARGRSALVLVPEISLTHQLARQLQARFGEQVAVLHSGLSDQERWREWKRAASGNVRVVAGARSAVFAPLPSLGLVVVDEEHDPAYKQEEGLRYHARDVAVMRAKLNHCPVVLVSATPSLESFHNARTGRYRLLSLPQRVQQRPMPPVEIVDLRGRGSAGRALPLSRTLIAALRANVAAEQQSLLFLNRRGFARVLQCVSCGASFSCPNCTVNLTYHRQSSALRCHYCNFTRPVPERCPQCHAEQIAAWGAGTEHLETELKRILGGANVARLDRDIAGRRGAVARLLADWEAGGHDVLVGTQMIAKGHDVHGVTLVGVLLADLSLHLPDFRANERTFQLLAQVAGRAGRGERPGRVIVQTFVPEHPVLRFTVEHDYQGFALSELALRAEARYPPFTRLVLLRCEAQQLKGAERAAKALAEFLCGQEAKGVEVLGPSPAPLERLRGYFRWHVLVRSAHGRRARDLVRLALQSVRPQLERNKVRVVVDVDPQSTL